MRRGCVWSGLRTHLGGHGYAEDGAVCGRPRVEDDLQGEQDRREAYGTVPVHAHAFTHAAIQVCSRTAIRVATQPEHDAASLCLGSAGACVGVRLPPLALSACAAFHAFTTCVTH